MNVKKVYDLRIWYRHQLSIGTIDKIIEKICRDRGLYPNFLSHDGEATLIYRLEKHDSYSDEDIQQIEDEINKKVDELITLKTNMELIK